MAQTKVVITTVGPYTEYGSPLLAAAAFAGVHYCDLSGEPFWQRHMIDEYDATARATGAKIILSAGYDSIPFGDHIAFINLNFYNLVYVFVVVLSVF